MFKSLPHVLIAALTLFSSLSAQANDPVPKMIFAHYMVAMPVARGHSSVEDYKREILNAQSYGIDGFALNCGGWTIEKKHPSYKERTQRIYQAAKELNTDFKIFISADFASPLTFAEFVDMVESFRGHPNQLTYEGKLLISTYLGRRIDLTQQVRTAFTDERAIALVPFYRPIPVTELPTDKQILETFESNQAVDGFFHFGAAGAPEQITNITSRMAKVWRGAGKLFMAPVTPYYRGHGGNFRAFECRGFEGMAKHWETAIETDSEWIEIVTWNDWNESSYIAPFGERKDTNLWDGYLGQKLSHEAYMEASRYYVDWFKTGVEPTIEKDEFYYFYRLHAKTVESPDGGFPDHVEKLEDEIFATVFLSKPATFKITCGASAKSFELPAGVNHVSISMENGTPLFELTRDGSTITSKQGEFSISPENAWANFNYFASSSNED